MPDITAALDEIRDRNERYIATQRLTEWTVAQEPCGDVRRLLAAVDAILALADSIAAPHAPPRGLYEGGYVDAERQLGVVFREEISRALLREERADG